MTNKKYLAAVLFAAIILSSSGVAASAAASFRAGSISASSAAITLEAARKIALKRVPGTIEDEYSIEDEDGNVTDYLFVIKDKKGKSWEVQIGAENGDVISAEEQFDEDEDGDEPSEEEDPPAVRAV